MPRVGGVFSKDFSVQVSTTNAGIDDFETVLTGTLKKINEPQVFPLENKPISARRVRLLIHSSYHPRGLAGLAEFEVLSPEGRNLVSTKEKGKLVSFSSQKNNKDNAAAQINDGLVDKKLFWASPNTDLNVCPWLRKSFDIKKVPGRALVTLNCTGYAELYINGQKAGTDVLTPAVAEDTKQTLYVTYDVTKLLKTGRNTMALWLGRGWASGVPQVRAQLNMQSEGAEMIVGTDESWKGRGSSYIHTGGWHGGNFGGERYDARDHIPSWNLPEFNDDTWSNVSKVTEPKGLVLAQQAPLNRIGAVISPVKITDLGGGKQEIDFGVALTGWLRMKMPPLKAGAEVLLSFADATKVAAKMGKSGYQTFGQDSRFISAGGRDEVFENKFNYAGFRYVIVEGLPSAVAKEDARAMLVESDLEEAGAFECSNELFNRIHRVTQWTQRCLNLGGYFVDCPTRERLGYGGDGQVPVEGFMSNFKSSEFYRKWLRDWRLRQREDGKLPNVAPTASGGGGPAWPGFVAAITWRHYLYYGDKTIVEENYNTIRRYVDWLEAQCKDDILKPYGGKWDFIGDWVPPERGLDTQNWPAADAAEFFNNCYRIYQWDLLRKMATVLGRSDEAARCEERLKAIQPKVHSAFYDGGNNRYVIDEQAYYVMPLFTSVTPEAEQAAVLRNLEKNILEKNKGHLDTGMLGTYFMFEYLRQIGRNDLIFTMFNQTTYPSFGYMVENGANTFWEQWNGFFSQIHACFTMADNWFYQGLAGIRPDPTGAGFKKIIIQPAVVGDLTWVKSHHDSPQGRIVSAWKREGNALTMDVSIPTNTTATIYVPTKDVASVTESGKPIASTEGVKLLREENNCSVYEVVSGKYQFKSQL